MDHPVVVGYNGKTPAKEALVWAANEATQRGLPLVVLFAANYPGMTLPPGDGLLEFSSDALDAAKEVTAQGVVEAKAAHLDLLEVWGETTVTSPTQALVEASSRASLVVVGSRGRGTVVGALLGSVSFAAARAACPVVVVKRESGIRLVGPDHRVVVGTDGSPPASATVRFAADFASSRSAALHVICSTGDDPLSIIDQQQLQHSAEEILQNACTDLQADSPPAHAGHSCSRRSTGASPHRRVNRRRPRRCGITRPRGLSGDGRGLGVLRGNPRGAMPGGGGPRHCIPGRIWLNAGGGSDRPGPPHSESGKGGDGRR